MSPLSFAESESVEPAESDDASAPPRPTPVTLTEELAVPEAFAVGDLGMRTFVREALEKRSAHDPVAARLLAERDADLARRGEPADDPLAWWGVREQQGKAYVPAPVVAATGAAPSAERAQVEEALTVSREHALEVLLSFDRTLSEPTRLLEVLGGIERGGDELGRWLRYRLRLAALRAAVADPRGALPLQQRAAFDAWRPGDVAPLRFGHVLIVASRLNAVFDRLREAVRTRCDARRWLVSAAEDAWEEPGEAHDYEAALEALARADETHPSLPTLGELHDDPDSDDHPYPDYEARDEYEERREDLESRGGITSAEKSIRHAATNSQVLIALSDWAEREDLLGGLSAERFRCSWWQVEEELRGVRGELEFLAAVEGNRGISNGSLARQLDWARREDLIDNATYDILASTARVALSYTGD